jgi:hypothetical protein
MSKGREAAGRVPWSLRRKRKMKRVRNGASMLYDLWICLRKVVVVSVAMISTTAMAAADDASPPVTWVKGSTVPLVQLPGEKFQYYANGHYFKDNTCSTTLSEAGVYGASPPSSSNSSWVVMPKMFHLVPRRRVFIKLKNKMQKA